MTPNEYQKEALRTASGMSQEYPRILNGFMRLENALIFSKSICSKAMIWTANTWQRNLAMLHGIWRLVRTLSGMIWKRSFR